MFCVVVQVSDQLVARQVSRVAVWNGKVREARELAHGVKVKPIVSPRPRAANASVLFEDDSVDSATGQSSRGRET
jgi:hypothetical protein